MSDAMPGGKAATPSEACGNDKSPTCTTIVPQPGAPAPEDAEEIILAAGDKDQPADPMRRSQYIAIEALVAGSNYDQTAEYARVNRKTVYRWLRNDKVFIAALEAAFKRAKQSAEHSLAGGAYRAAQTLAVAAAKGDVRAATSLLKFIGIGKTPPAFETDARARSGRSSKPRRLKMQLRELLLSLTEEQDEQSPAAEAKPQLRDDSANPPPDGS